ncbi:sensor histidine kinase [Actinophytocola sp.]|uniref:sensor histidine kinase n=1 Tax=Actinophytocola sp. TaxID=1872138 RepID=UPI0025C2E066|nr:sensor histidine kinase [Actinophytocola sp.]
MSRPSPASAFDAGLRWFRLWDGYFALGYVALVALLLNSDEPAPAAKAVTVACLSLIAVWYVTFGRRAILLDRAIGPARGRIFAAGLAVLLTVAVLVESSAAFALFAVCPMVFMSLRLGEAIAVIIPINLLPALTVVIDDGIGEVVPKVGPTTLLTIAFAVFFGTWINRVIAQSEERAELIKELEQSREEVERLSREAGVSAERARLAAEIHDTLAQGFTSLVTLVQAAESELDGDPAKARRHLELAARTARENLGEARALVAGLMPSAMGTGSLDDAIRRQVERLAEETPVKATYRVEGESVALPTATEVVLLRTVQESLTNVRKHAGASMVTICLRVNGTAANLRVTDDGSGFDPSRAFEGYGLRGMRSRAGQIGGSLSVHSGVSGTTVELEVPR